MKTFSRFLTKIVTCLLLVSLCFSMFACNKDKGDSSGSSSNPPSSEQPGGNEPGQEYQGIEIDITSNVDSIKYGESAQLTVTVKNSTKGYFVSSSLPDVVAISDKDVVTITKNIVTNRTVMITATSREDSSVKDSLTLTLLPAPVEGTTANLTSAMIAEIGNSSITATSIVTDYQVNMLDSSDNYSASYKSVVKMQENLWYGAWTDLNADGTEGDVWQSSVYGKGDEVVDTYDFELGQLTSGYPVETYTIDKNNQVSKEIVTDSDSFPVLWSSQHYWNHLGDLVVTNFELKEENGEAYYSYKIDPMEMDPDEVDSLWLPTYLVYSLTAMVADTFHSLAIYVQDDHITKIKGSTEYVYMLSNGEYTSADQAEFLTYSEIEIDLSDIGSTTVPMPAPYEADVNDLGSDKILSDALAKMQAATNYTMHIVDNNTIAPSGSEGDYDIMSASSNSSVKTLLADSTGSNSPFKPNTSTGTVGKLVQVTEDAIFVEETGKYSYGMDDKLYHYTYYGYKQVSEDMYDYYELANGTLYGKRKIAGNIADQLPSFDFNSALFSFRGQAFDNKGNVVGYRYVIKDTGITNAIGRELVFEDGGYADASTRSILSLVVGTDGNLKSVSVPYNSNDTWFGTYEISFTNYGTTEIASNVFVGYEERQIPSSWAQTNTKYYKADPLAPGGWEDMDTESVIKNIWGVESSASLGIPTPAEFIEIFSDNMNGPFFDYSTATDEDGNLYVSERTFGFSFTLPYSAVDKNFNLMNDSFNYYYEQLEALLISKGFSCSEENIDGGASGRGNRKAVFAKDSVKIVITNNFTRFIDLDVYKI